MCYFIHITQYFDRTVAQYPGRLAVCDGDEEMSFAVLHERVLHLALALHHCLDGRVNQVIAVYLPKSTDSLIADLAIAQSGNAYMNLDVKNPAQRIDNILRQVQPALVLTREELLSGLPPLRQPFFLMPNQNTPLPADERRMALRLREACIDTDPLCVINTSGSTGTPKAVVLNHRSFIDFTEVVLEAGLLGETEVIGSLSPLFFDIYSFELCMLMACGSTLVILPDTLAAFPARLLELMVARRVSFIFWVPTIMVNIANMNLLRTIPLPDLKKVWFAGEVFPTAKCNYWRNCLPEAMFVNLYGPIEITLDCLYYVLSRKLRDDEPVPIGRPFKNTGILVLDEENHPVKLGQEGELCVRGSSLSMGYYNNLGKTVAAFVQNPLNTAYPEIIYRTGDIVAFNEEGELIYKGRKDTLIKHMGYRIELAEIEHITVSELELVSNCCTVYDASAKRITLFYEADMPLLEKDLRKRLSQILPRYMMPSAYIHLRELPRNGNGKIDRLLLKQSLEN